MSATPVNLHATAASSRGHCDTPRAPERLRTHSLHQCDSSSRAACFDAEGGFALVDIEMHWLGQCRKRRRGKACERFRLGLKPGDIDGSSVEKEPLGNIQSGVPVLRKFGSANPTISRASVNAPASPKRTPVHAGSKTHHHQPTHRRPEHNGSTYGRLI